ncbi:ABC transporter permease [Paenibacillus mendelii]|uniref:ABC transporter permease n=1 Tax=Paenibacillus mendelii TaxID=206163 RepID=A0ABV6JHH5_9BACL|nr:ABC-2 family transporter protein [Paenibacillus mendelii]MCQ6558233.1 ABC-2 family transporter protein [Paenibacillus mendelii]
MNGRLSFLSAKGRKIEAIYRITLRQQLAYKVDFMLRASFLLLILYVFIQLWSAAYEGDTERLIAGFSLKQIIWYLVFTEALTMASPQLSLRIEEEVKNGDIAIRLIRPLSYLSYHYSSYMAEAVFRFGIHLVVGSFIAWLFVGPPTFGFGWLGLLSLSAGALTIAFLLNGIVAMCAFWIEETRGLEFVLQKLKFTVGGMLLPIDLMPEWLQRICAWLPFQAVLYIPARTAVAYEEVSMLQYFAVQAAWIVVLGIGIWTIYRRGVTRLHVNGG